MTTDGLPQHVRVAVIGAGFGGIGAAHVLRRAGVEDVLVLERRPRLGGTWWDNTYPGIACDIASHVYSFSFAPYPYWSRSFATGPEIQRYLEWVTDRFGLRSLIRFGTDVTGASWDEAGQCWRLSTSAGQLSADILVSAAGPLAEPRLPDVPGLADFAGEVLHTARWRPEVELSGKRIAVVGTGASAIQVIPHLQRQAETLYVYQRSAAWVLPKGDRALTRAEQALYRRVPLAGKLPRAATYLTREATVIGFTRQPAVLQVAAAVSRRHLARSVRDPQLREQLTPDYHFGCKRVLPSNDYYPAMAQPNVELIPAALARVEGKTLVGADGTARDADVLVLATGFAATQPPVARLVRGRDGRTLAETWAGSGMQALRGTTVHGFPNLFVVIGPNTGLGHNSMIQVIESQLTYLVDAVRSMDAEGLASVEPRRDAQQAWNHRLAQLIPRTVWARGGCTSWYQDDQGRITTLWPYSSLRFRRELHRFDLAEYATTRRPSAAPSFTVTSADGTRLRCSQSGPQDAPTIVLAHGWTLSAGFFDQVVAALDRDYRVVRYDQRGHGDSGPAGPSGYTTQALAEDLAAVLQEVVPDGQQAVLGGHSMGAMTVLALAEHRPEVLQAKVCGVLLASTGVQELLLRGRLLPLPRVARRAVGPVVAEVMSRPPARGRDGALARAMIRFSSLTLRAPRQAVAVATRTVLACPPEVQRGFADMLWSLDLTAAVSRLTVPTHVVVGSADRLTPPWHARGLAETLPDCTGLTVVPRVGHMTPVECPAVLARQLRLLRGASEPVAQPG